LTRLHSPEATVAQQTTPRALTIRNHAGRDLAPHLDRLEGYVARARPIPLSYHPAWLAVFQSGLGHVPYCLEAVEGGKTRGFLALAYVRSLLFGRFLVSLPYLNYGGALADDDDVGIQLIDRAVELAHQLRVRYLNLRHERPADHPALGARLSTKVHMRLELPDTLGKLWDRLSAKVRNLVRKGLKCGLTTAWGEGELLPEFYAVFSRNMRDLGTPVYGRALFQSILHQFPGRAELCVVRAAGRAVAAALLLHGWGVTEVPSASSLREANHTSANMLMYWNLLERAVQRQQQVFDFGRSTRDSNTFRFKKQWGAVAAPAEWQYHLLRGGSGDMRPDNPRYRHFIRLWQRLPVPLTRWIGPGIVRGIP
jgi:FemAB-related protein (PEP-CTERM system-associated)